MPHVAGHGNARIERVFFEGQDAVVAGSQELGLTRVDAHKEPSRDVGHVGVRRCEGKDVAVKTGPRYPPRCFLPRRPAIAAAGRR